MAHPQAADGPAAPEAAPSRARLLVFVAWCVWLLAWLAPSMLLAPHVAAAPVWMTQASSPAAFLAAVGLFVVAAWPFLPALAPARGAAQAHSIPRGGSPEPPRRAPEPGPYGPRGTLSDPPRGTVPLARLIGLSVPEMVVLAALAAPFGVVAWSLGEGRLAVGPAAATAAGLGVLSLGVRVAASAGGPGAERWLMAAALLVCAAPAALAYAAAETVGGSYAWLAEASPVVALVQAGDGWAEGAWPQAARLWLWPAVGAVLIAVSAIASASRPEVERP